MTILMISPSENFEMTQEEIVYKKHMNLKIAADELGIKWQNLYIKLRNQGVPVTGDKMRYGSDKDRLAAKAELEFKKLVPYALDQNSIQFQSKFDYLIGKEKVDIKASTLKQGCKRFAARRWAFSVKKQEFCADFIVCFAFYENEYRVFLIPGELIRNYNTISISENGKSKWLQYEINPDELNEFFSFLIEEK